MTHNRAAFLFVCLTFCCLAENKPIAPDGSGTKTNPYKISRIENFVWLSENPSLLSELSYLSLENDIDASETANWNDETGFTPIGLLDNPNIPYDVKVDFDGKGNTISGLYINRLDGKHVGLFASIKDSNISNFIISNSFFSGYRQMGAIAGNAESSKFKNCIVANSDIICSVTNISGFGTHVWIGGLVGNSKDGTVFENCEFSGRISGVGEFGGIAGYAKKSKFSDSVSKVEFVDFSSDAYAKGGIVGNSIDSKILRCVSEINCFNSTNGYGIGGVAGFASINETEIKCSCARGQVSGNYSIGGIIGDGGGLIENCYARCGLSGNWGVGGIIGTVASFCTVSNCYSLGDISAEYDLGGIVGNDYYQSEITNCVHSLRPLSGWESSRIEMKNPSTYIGWDFDTIWNINDGEGYPYFQWEVPEPMLANLLLAFLFSFAYMRKQ